MGFILSAKMKTVWKKMQVNIIRIDHTLCGLTEKWIDLRQDSVFIAMTSRQINIWGQQQKCEPNFRFHTNVHIHKFIWEFIWNEPLLSVIT